MHKHAYGTFYDPLREKSLFKSQVVGKSNNKYLIYWAYIFLRERNMCLKYVSSLYSNKFQEESEVLTTHINLNTLFNFLEL